MTLKEILNMKAGDVLIVTETNLEMPIISVGAEHEYFVTLYKGREVKRAMGQLIKTKGQYHFYKPALQSVKERINSLEVRVMAAEKAMQSVWTIGKLIGADTHALSAYRTKYPKALYGEINENV